MIEAAGTALVTGGAKRIGKAIVEDLAAHGFAVAIHCNRSRVEADVLAAVLSGALSLEGARKTGRLQAHGPKSQAARMLAVFRFPSLAEPAPITGS